jgi:hypothetical protein
VEQGEIGKWERPPGNPGFVRPAAYSTKGPSHPQRSTLSARFQSGATTVARHQGKAGAAYEHALHDVWSVMNRLQKELAGAAG